MPIAAQAADTKAAVETEREANPAQEGETKPVQTKKTKKQKPRDGDDLIHMLMQTKTKQEPADEPAVAEQRQEPALTKTKPKMVTQEPVQTADADAKWEARHVAQEKKMQQMMDAHTESLLKLLPEACTKNVAQVMVTQLAKPLEATLKKVFLSSFVPGFEVALNDMFAQLNEMLQRSEATVTQTAVLNRLQSRFPTLARFSH